MKKSAKRVKIPKTEMPDLVGAMIKLVERLEVLEKKTDQVLSRVSNLPSEMKQAYVSLQRPEPSHHPQPAQHPTNNSQQNQGMREKILFDATCADCLKGCKVPFRPSENRPVYCPACFAIRKAGHAPKDIASNIVVPQHLRALGPVPVASHKPAAPVKTRKPTSKAAKKHSKKKK